MKKIVSFNDNGSLSAAVCGGKALKLMERYKKGEAVPIGIILTVDFFDEWHEAIAKSSNKKTCISQLDLSQDLKKDLLRTIEELKLGQNPLFAVRSSSPEEDLDNASFAGAYESVLGVSISNIEDAIRTCFASCFDERIARYKEEHGINGCSPQIAVIIQKMVKAESAGVAFSLNPQNNCYDEAVINANFGLGESVVSGETEPDQFVVEKNSKVILDKQCGTKQVQVNLLSNGGTITNKNNKLNAFCISDEDVFRITQLVTDVEKSEGYPVDIEWAIENGNLFLLQVRPITTYYPLPPEMITEVSAQKKLYANSTLIEQGLQEPLSALGTDFMKYILEQMSSSMPKGSVNNINGGAFVTDGQYFMNVGVMCKMTGGNELAPGSSDDQTVLDILKEIDMEQYIPKELSTEIKKARKQAMFSMMKYGKQIKAAMKNPEEFIRKFYEELPNALEKFNVEPEKFSLEEYAKAVTAPLDFFFMTFGMPTFFGANMARKELEMLFSEDNEDVHADIQALSMALPNNITVLMNKALYELAANDEITKFSNVNDFLNAKISEKTKKQWNNFIKEFGARCSNEVDVGSTRPHEQPEVIFSQILALKDRAKDGNFFENAKKTRQEAYARLLKIVKSHGDKVLDTFLVNSNILYNFGGFRETGKQYIVKSVDLVRKKALKLGEQFVSEGRLDRKYQVADLKICDIDNAINDKSLDLRELIEKRNEHINKLKRCHIPVRIIDSRGKIYMPKAKVSEDGAMVGLAISSGVTRGYAKVLHSPDEKPLHKGEILVASATNPGWTPLFINAAGLVLEIGGTLQHGAVVAREYGIPCASGITGAVVKIKDGDLLEVDGTNGIVRIIDENAPEQRDRQINILEKEKRVMRIAEKNKQKKMKFIKMAMPFAILILMTFGVGGIAILTVGDINALIEKYQLLISLTTNIPIVMLICGFVLNIVKRKKRIKLLKDRIYD